MGPKQKGREERREESLSHKEQWLSDRIGMTAGAWLEDRVPVCAEGDWAGRGAGCSLSSVFL